jgi:hypothetical protein
MADRLYDAKGAETVQFQEAKEKKPRLKRIKIGAKAA